MITIFQIHYGKDKSRDDMMGKWASLVKANPGKFKYKVYRKAPKKYMDMTEDYRFCSDFHRIDILSKNQRHLYVDTDTEPGVNFADLDFGEGSVFPSTIDNLMYNGKDTELFKCILKVMLGNLIYKYTIPRSLNYICEGKYKEYKINEIYCKKEPIGFLRWKSLMYMPIKVDDHYKHYGLTLNKVEGR